MATPNMPSGAVASELAKEGRKKTTFLDIDLFSKLQSQRCVMGSARIVTVMSHGCHFFLRGVLGPQFRATVDIIVTATIFFNPTTLPFHAEFFLAGSRCLLCTNSCDVLRLFAPWRAAKNLQERAPSKWKSSRTRLSHPTLQEFRIFGAAAIWCLCSWNQRVSGVGQRALGSARALDRGQS